MRVFDNIKFKDIDEFAEWLDKKCWSDDAPWMSWFDKNYCKKCEPVSIDGVTSWDNDYAYCEIHKKCRFFPNLDEAPNCKQIIKLWLESEEDDGIQN